jgi:hypothetical protein
MRVEDKASKPIQIPDAKTVEEVFRRAVRQALLMHKRAGNPIAVWEDGKVVLIQPEDIPVDDPLDKKSNP